MQILCTVLLLAFTTCLAWTPYQDRNQPFRQPYPNKSYFPFTYYPRQAVTCWVYHDQAARHRLIHSRAGYPLLYVKKEIHRKPYLHAVLYGDSPGQTGQTGQNVGQKITNALGSRVKRTITANSPLPQQPHVQARLLNEVCPSNRYTLYRFYGYNGKCWVINPDYQNIKYTRCDSSNNRDCKSCSQRQRPYYYNPYYRNEQRRRIISKCVETFETVHVWTYCEKLPEYSRIVRIPITVPTSCNCKIFEC